LDLILSNNPKFQLFLINISLYVSPYAPNSPILPPIPTYKHSYSLTFPVPKNIKVLMPLLFFLNPLSTKNPYNSHIKSSTPKINSPSYLYSTLSAKDP
jgi:hypothetical protein